MSITNQQDLLQKIMSRAIVKGEQGPKNNKLSNQTVYQFTGNQRVNIPGNVIMNDIGFFGQPNPFMDVATARFQTEPLEDKINAFPQPSYYNTVLVNDANSPIMPEPSNYHTQITLQEMMMERQALKTQPKIATTQIFPELTKNTPDFL